MSERPNRTSRRAGGRAARGEAQTATAPAYAKRNIGYFEPYTQEQIDTIINDAETLLEEIGIDFREDAEVLEIWKDKGANVDGERVRFPKGMLRDLLKLPLRIYPICPQP